MRFVIERHIANLAADRIGVTAGEFVREVAGQVEVFVGFGPNFRLVFVDPVGFDFGLQVNGRFLHARQGKTQTPQPANGFESFCAALI